MTEQERILHNINNYYKYCLYNAVFLLKRSTEENARDTDKQDARMFMRISIDLNSILGDKCPMCKEFTQEDVLKLWESR